MIALAWLKLLLTGAALATSPCAGCNVVLISLDTVSASHLGAYGAGPGKSPGLDELARSSVLYRNAFVPAPWTMPSHVAMLTGIYPWHLGTTTGLEALHPEAPYLPQLLKERGYRTAAFTSGYFINPSYGYARGFDVFRESPDTKDTAFLSAESAKWIGEHAREKFFLFLHSYTAHDPFRPSEASRRKLDAAYQGSTDEISSTAIAKASRQAPNAALFARMRTLYDAGVLDADALVGAVLARLRAEGLLGRTIVIVTADHGEELGEHGRWGFHGHTVYNELVRVPLVVKAPGIAARAVESPVSGADLVPSILGALDLPPPPGLDGKPLPERDTAESRKRVVQAETQLTFEFVREEMEGLEAGRAAPRPACEQKPFFLNTGAERALVSWPWKLIVRGSHAFELYDLSRDPAERRNLYPARKRVALRLMEELLKRP